MKRKFPAARIPAYTLLTAMIVLSVFYYFHIQQNERYLVRRAFQTLVDMSEDILAKVESADDAAENICRSRDKKCTVPADSLFFSGYFHRRVRDVEAYDLRPGLLTRVYPLRPKPVAVGLQLDPFIGRVREKELLDAVVLADEKGKLIRKWTLLPGAGALAPDVVERALEIEKSQRGKPDGDVVFDGRSGGLPHRFLLHRFTVPAVRLRTSGSEDVCVTPDGKVENCPARTQTAVARAAPAEAPTGAAGDRTLILCGLIASDRLRSESMQIPHSIALLLVFFVLLAITSMPLLQVQFMSARQRFSRMDLLSVVLGNILAGALLTCGFLTMHYFLFSQRARTDFQLKALASEIETGVEAEVSAIRRQMAALSTQFAGATASGAKADLKRANLLSCREPVAYPFFDTAIWIDSAGCQRAKWTILKENTPFVNVKEREYFRAPRDCRLWDFGDPKQGFFLESFRSKNTAQFRSAVSIPLTSTTAGCEGALLSTVEKGEPPVDKDLAVATVVGRLMSLMEPALPAGFGFAVVDASAKVMFHSVEGRGQRENFLEETDSDGDLRAAFVERRTRAVNVDYYGRPHRVLVHQFTRLRSAPWTLLVFRDKSASRAAMVQVLTISGRLLIWYAIGLAICFGLLFLLPRREPLECVWVNLMRRVWPDPRLAERYRKVAVALAAALAVMAIVVAWGPLWAKIATAVVSLAALPAGVLYISARPPACEPRTTTVPLSYSAVAFLLVMILAIAPCGAFYRAALEFEGEVQSRYSQLALWKRLTERSDRVERLFDGGDVSLDEAQRGTLVKRRLLTPLMSGPETGSGLLPDVYLAKSFRQSPWAIAPEAPFQPGPVTAYLRSAMSGYRGQFDRHSRESQQALADRAPDGSWIWVSGNGGQPELSSSRSDLRIAALSVPVSAGPWSAVALVALVVFGAVWIWLCVRRVFFFETDPNPGTR